MTDNTIYPPIREHGEGVLSQELRNLREQFAGIAALHPNEQPHYPNGVRPFGTGDLRHVIEVLDTAIAALSAQPVKEPDQELQEIADGAYGDGPNMRGRARDALIAQPVKDAVRATRQSVVAMLDGLRFGAAWLDDPQTLGDVFCDGIIPDPNDDSAAAVYEARQTLIYGILTLSPKSPASVGLDPDTLRDALDQLGYTKVFNAISDAVTVSDAGDRLAKGISVEALIFALTGIPQDDARWLSAKRAKQAATDLRALTPEDRP